MSANLEQTITQQAERIAEIKAERDALAISVHQLREAIKRQCEADDRLMNAPFNVRKEEYEAALEEHSASHDAFVKLINEKLINEPDTTVNIIKRHDAAVLRKAAEHLEGYEYVFNAPPINYAEAHELRLMANELEKSCQP